MGRLKLKPNYNSTLLDSKLLEQVSSYYLDILGDTIDYIDEEESAYKYVIETAKEFDVTPMKMRKTNY